MAKENKKLDILNVGLVGHIDHGKTTLLQKLSGKWASTHSEELKRGITIRLGYADIIIYKDAKEEYNIKGNGEALRKISFIDAPGHEMLMATMLSGAALIDIAILVVAVNEGIKPQTREHVMALKAKGIKKIIVAQNKIDLVDQKKAEKNYEEIKSFLKGKYDDAFFVPVSAQQGVNIDAIWKVLSEIEIPKRESEGNPIFLVARSFDINRPGISPENLHGAVLGGILKKGKLKLGDEIEIKPGRVIKDANKLRYEPIYTKILKLFIGSEEVTELTPGGSAGIETELDMALSKADSLKGNIVSLKNMLSNTTEKINLKFKLFQEVFGVGANTRVENIKLSETLMISINTSISGGAVVALNDDMMSVSLKVPVIAFKDDYVGIARNIQGHWRLIGYGNVVL